MNRISDSKIDKLIEALREIANKNAGCRDLKRDRKNCRDTAIEALSKLEEDDE